MDSQGKTGRRRPRGAQQRGHDVLLSDRLLDAVRPDVGRGLRADRLLHLEHRYSAADAECDADATRHADTDADADADAEAYHEDDGHADSSADAGSDARALGFPDSRDDTGACAVGLASATASALAPAECRESPQRTSFEAPAPSLRIRGRRFLVVERVCRCVFAPTDDGPSKLQRGTQFRQAEEARPRHVDGQTNESRGRQFRETAHE